MVVKQIEINGTNYPCFETMGMYVRFRRMFDIELEEADMTNSLYICGRLFCMIQAASKASDVEFPYDFESFCDCLSQEKFVEIVKQICKKREGKEEQEKKEESR